MEILEKIISAEATKSRASTEEKQYSQRTDIESYCCTSKYAVHCVSSCGLLISYKCGTNQF